MPRILQPSFSKGEIAPELEGRTDLASYFSAVRKAQNCFVHQYGGLSNRQGLRFVAPVGDKSARVRVIPFVFGSTDTHLLEFGDGYFRPLRQNANITESPIAISGATQANPVVITTGAAHGLATGDEIIITDVVGMTELNTKRFTVTFLTGTTFSLQDKYTGANVDGTGYAAYSSGGNVNPIYQIDSPYGAADLQDMQFEQSFDVLYITASGHPRRRLERLGLTNWQFVDLDTQPATAAPTSFALTVNSGTGTVARYAVTAVNTDTEEESSPALGVSTDTITAISQTNPVRVTVTSGVSGLETGHEVELSGIVGMTELNGIRATVSKVSATQFDLQGIDGTSFNAYVSGGSMTAAFEYAASSGATADNTLDWVGSPNALRYIIYKELNGVFGFLAETQDTTFTDDGSIDPDTSDSLPIPRNPFLGEANFPSVIGSHQQRSILANTQNNSALIEFSQIGAFDNFNRSIPSKDNDAFSITIDSRGENAEIRHLVSIRNLVVFTNSSIKTVTSNDLAFTLKNINIKGEDRFGSSKLRPLVVRKRILFQEENGERVHAASFSFSADGLQTEDLTILSPHLFQNRKITEWAEVSWPEPIIHMVMDDGTALALTYNPEEQAQITGWAPWDTVGTFESVASVRANPTDKAKSVYFVVNRTVNGVAQKFIEVLDDRSFTTSEDCFFVDSGLSYDPAQAIEAVSIANPAVITVTGHNYSNDDIIDIDNCSFQTTQDKFGNVITNDNLSGRRFKVKNSTANTFQLEPIDQPGVLVDSSAFPAYLGGGQVRFAAQTLFGFEHLAGSTLVGLLDGNVVKDLVVNSDGTITLPERSSRAHIGVPYISEIQTLPFEQPSNGSISGLKKTPREVVIRVLRSRGMFIKETSSAKFAEWYQREFEKWGEPTKLFTGEFQINPVTTTRRNASLTIRQLDPLPLTILQINSDVKTSS